MEQPPDLSSYLVEEHVRDAIDWIQDAQQPWFCYLAPQAPYELYQWPLTQYGTCSAVPIGDECGPVTGGNIARREAYDATLEALDSFLGDLLDELDQEAQEIHPVLRWWHTTTIFFVGDNGTAKLVARPPFSSTTSKESIFEGGVRVPFLIAGRGVHSSRWGDDTDEPVNTVDVFTTAYRLAGASAPPGRQIDGLNLRPYLRATPPATPARPFVYAEMWNLANGPCWKGGPTPDRVYRSVNCDPKWKIHFSLTQGSSVFYDLSIDPCERTAIPWASMDPTIRDCLWNEVDALIDAATCDDVCP